MRRHQLLWLLTYLGLALGHGNPRKLVEPSSSTLPHNKAQHRPQYHQQMLHYQQQLLIPMAKEWLASEKEPGSNSKRLSPTPSTAMLLPVVNKSPNSLPRQEDSYYKPSAPRVDSAYKKAPQSKHQKQMHVTRPGLPHRSAIIEVLPLIRSVRGNRRYDVAQVGEYKSKIIQLFFKVVILTQDLERIEFRHLYTEKFLVQMVRFRTFLTLYYDINVKKGALKFLE